MIFVTVGSTGYQFSRLVDAVKALPADEVVLQHGPARPPRGLRATRPFMPFLEILKYMDEADWVVSHAGVGSILAARRAGHVPVVVPRLKRFGETVDDHQLQLAKLLAERGVVLTVTDLASLGDVVAAAPKRGSTIPVLTGPLHHAVRQALAGTDRSSPRVPANPH